MATPRSFIDLQLVGGREFLIALKALERTGMQAHVIQPALRESGEFVRRDVERNIPRDVLAPHIAETLRLTVAKTRARVIVGKGGKPWLHYAKFVEYGTRTKHAWRGKGKGSGKAPGLPARPFMRPALDRNKARIIAIFTRQLQMVVDRIARNSRGARGSVTTGGYTK